MMAKFGGRQTFGWVFFRFKLDKDLKKKEIKHKKFEDLKKERKEKEKIQKKVNISK